MPLIVEGKSTAIIHSELRALGFWMTVKGAVPVRPVRVFVSYEALADLNPSNIRDLAAAVEHFDKFEPASKRPPVISLIGSAPMPRSMKVCRPSD